MFVDKKTPHQMSVLSKVTCKPTAMPSKSQKSFIKHSDELILKPKESRRGGGGAGTARRTSEESPSATPNARRRPPGRPPGTRAPVSRHRAHAAPVLPERKQTQKAAFRSFLEKIEDRPAADLCLGRTASADVDAHRMNSATSQLEFLVAKDTVKNKGPAAGWESRMPPGTESRFPPKYV